MDPETDDDDSVLDPFIVPDSQIPEDDDENDGNKAMKEQEKVNDKHVMVLEKLDISVHPVEKDHEEGYSLDVSKEDTAKSCSGKTDTNSSTDRSFTTVQLGSDEVKYNTDGSCTPEYQTEKKEEPHKDLFKSSSSHSTSFEILRSASDASSVSGNSIEPLSPTCGTTKDSLIEMLNAPNLSRHTSLSSGDKWGSISSCFPSTSASSHRSMDTPNISSSPEHQLSHPFAIPTKAAPVQKHYGSSSEGSSSENAKETSPKRKKWMQAIKGKDSENSESSGDSQGPFSHPHSTPVELSSREVTHLDPPGLRSTPTEMSFECLQLSGECHKLTTSVYSMPDALSASPSTEVMPGPNQIYHLSESAKADKKEPDVKDKRESVCTLPKWLENEIEKRIDFDNASDAYDSVQKSSSSSATFPGRDTISLSTRSSSAAPDVSMELASQDFPLAKLSNSQSIDKEVVNFDEYPESCVYPVQDIPKNVAGADFAHEEPGEICGPDENIGDSHKLDVSSPSVLPPSQTSVVSINSKTLQMKKASQVQEVSSEKDRHESHKESSKLELSLPLSGSQVAHVQLGKGSSLETEKDVKHEEEGSLVTDRGPGLQSTGIDQPQTDFSLSFITAEKEENVPQTQLSDMEIEMSQDLFNPPLTVSQTTPSQETETRTKFTELEPTGTFPNAHKREKIPEDQNAEFNLFLSQTQQEASQHYEVHKGKESPLSFNSESLPIRPEPSPISQESAKEKRKLTDIGKRDSIESPKATPSQSILPQDDKTDPSFTIVKSIHTDIPKDQAKGLHIPRDVLDRVSSNEFSSSNRFHMSLPPDGGSFRPIRTLTPPFRNMELRDEPSQETDIQPDDDKTVSVQGENRQAMVDKSKVILTSKDTTKTGDTQFIEESEGKFELPKISGFPSVDANAEPMSEIFVQESETIYAKAIKAAKNGAKRYAASPSVESDPFAFKETQSQDEPLSKRRKLSADASKKSLPRPKLPEDKSDSQIFCKVVSRTVTVTETVVTRKFITEVRSIDGETVYKRTEFSEKGAPVRSITEECSAPVEVVSMNSLSMETDKDESKDKKTPKRHTPKRSCKKSPKISQKRRRSSSSTPPEGNTGETKRAKSTKEATAAEGNDKTEYEKLLELASAEESGKTRRQTRSSVKGDKSHDESLQVGMHGLGKWLDNCYFPGKIIEKKGTGRFKMRFHDEKELVLTANMIIPENKIQSGQTVCARDSEDSFYYQGIISKVNRAKDGSIANYDVKLDTSGATKRFNVGDIMLDAQQKSLLEKRSIISKRSKEEINHACLEESNRVAELKVMVIEPTNTAEREKQGSKTRRRLNEIKQRREESSLFMISSSSPEVESFQFRIYPTRRRNGQTESQQASASNGKRVQCKVKSIKDSEDRIRERWERIERLKHDKELLRLHGLLPDDPNLFKGYSFLVTYISSKSNLDAEMAFRCKNFKRSHVACQLTAGGGTVVDSVRNLQNLPKDKVILIAPICQKTLKYYFALSYGIPCVSHFWVIDCCKNNQFLSFEAYLLEAGIDQVTGMYVYAHQRTQPLRGFKIYVKALDEDREGLSLAVRYSGAEVISELPQSNDNNTKEFDFILVGENVVIKRTLVSISNKLQIPFVTLKWFCQCVIHGEFVNPDSSSLFIYNNS